MTGACKMGYKMYRRNRNGLENTPGAIQQRLKQGKCVTYGVPTLTVPL